MMDEDMVAFLNRWYFTRQEKLRAVISVARLIADSPPRSAQLVRLLSSLKEKIEELDKE